MLYCGESLAWLLGEIRLFLLNEANESTDQRGVELLPHPRSSPPMAPGIHYSSTYADARSTISTLPASKTAKKASTTFGSNSVPFPSLSS